CSVSPATASESLAAHGCCGKSLCLETDVPHRAGGLGGQHSLTRSMLDVGNLLWGSHRFPLPGLSTS
ncbi:hypothetical protein HGM15179_009899, partial [Zosterops borbonicus]